jgi:CRP/FNR family transcriptional regulator, cyclic AMP receptor protein
MVDILGPLSDEELEDLAKRAPDTFLEQEDILCSPQHGTERLFILKKGRVQLYEVDQSGEEITLSVIEDGNVFGEMALTDQTLEGLYVRAMTPSTVVSLRREDLEDLIKKQPEVGLRLIRALAEKLHASERRYADVVGKDVPARLATLIITLVDTEGVVLSLLTISKLSRSVIIAGDPYRKKPQRCPKIRTERSRFPPSGECQTSCGRSSNRS